MEMTIHPIDIALIVGYFAVVIGIGVYVSRQTKSGDDLFLAGRALGFGVIGFSLFASNISAQTLIGLAGDAYETGIAVSAYEWMAGLVLVFAAIFVLPFYIRTKISTIPEFLERRYDGRVRLYLSSITIFLSIIVDMAGGLYAGSLVLDKLFFPGQGGEHLFWFCLGLGLFAGIYTAAGGLKAVVLTDVLQAVILIIGSAAMGLIIFDKFDWSWAKATAELPEGHLSMIRPADDDVLPWPGLLLGVPLIGFYYWTMNQYIIQRALGAKNLEAARAGAMLGGALKLLPLFIMILPAAFAISLFPDIENKDQVFPTMVTELLPVGAVGLVLAGLIAAIMSSVDSTLNSASTLVTLDFIKPNKPDLSPRQTVFVGRVCTFVFMAIAIAWAPQIKDFPGLWNYIQSAFAYITTPLVAIFLTGLFWKGAHPKAGFWALALGHVTSAALFALGPIGGVINVHFTIMAIVLTVWTAVLLVIVSLVLGQNFKLAQHVTWPPDEKSTDMRPGGMLSDYRLQAGVLVLLTVIMVLVFW
ncbi:MAG: hypothetical protein CMP06_01680 [Xanthomonadales bacterium]|nr:hypothetical protein [Xanthomonadales bacterium]